MEQMAKGISKLTRALVASTALAVTTLLAGQYVEARGAKEAQSNEKKIEAAFGYQSDSFMILPNGTIVDENGNKFEKHKDGNVFDKNGKQMPAGFRKEAESALTLANEQRKKGNEVVGYINKVKDLSNPTQTNTLTVFNNKECNNTSAALGSYLYGLDADAKGTKRSYLDVNQNGIRDSGDVSMSDNFTKVIISKVENLYKPMKAEATPEAKAPIISQSAGSPIPSKPVTPEAKPVAPLAQTQAPATQYNNNQVALDELKTELNGYNRKVTGDIASLTTSVNKLTGKLEEQVQPHDDTALIATLGSIQGQLNSLERIVVNSQIPSGTKGTNEPEQKQVEYKPVESKPAEQKSVEPKNFNASEGFGLGMLEGFEAEFYPQSQKLIEKPAQSNSLEGKTAEVVRTSENKSSENPNEFYTGNANSTPAKEVAKPAEIAEFPKMPKYSGKFVMDTATGYILPEFMLPEAQSTEQKPGQRLKIEQPSITVYAQPNIALGLTGISSIGGNAGIRYNFSKDFGLGIVGNFGFSPGKTLESYIGAVNPVTERHNEGTITETDASSISGGLEVKAGPMILDGGITGYTSNKVSYERIMKGSQIIRQNTNAVPNHQIYGFGSMSVELPITKDLAARITLGVDGKNGISGGAGISYTINLPTKFSYVENKSVEPVKVNRVDENPLPQFPADSNMGNMGSMN